MKTNTPDIFSCIVKLIIMKKIYKVEARESRLGAYSEIQRGERVVDSMSCGMVPGAVVCV